MSTFDEAESYKIKWQGTIISIQPRTRVWRYVTDNRTHYHIGYNLFLIGTNDDNDLESEYSVAISEKQYQKEQFRIGDVIKGTGWIKKYPKREFADYYRAGALKVIKRNLKTSDSECPWICSLPNLDVYEERGARMLSKSLWKNRCFTCIWATMANVEIQWDFDKNIKRYRFESFCYGPKSCTQYKMGRVRSVPYKNRESSIDDGYLDELCTEEREWDD